jgi:hypothetical protein
MPVHFSQSKKSSKSRGIRTRVGKNQMAGEEGAMIPSGTIKINQPAGHDHVAFQVVTGKPQGIVQGIAQKLSGSNELDISKITVNVSKQTVTLKGQIADRNSLLNTLGTIHSVEGVNRVDYEVKFRNGRQSSGFFPLASAGPHGGGEPPDK